VALTESFVDAVARRRHSEEGWPSAAYNVSKVAMNAFVRILARDLGGRIRVNAVCPGWVRTDMGGTGASRPASVGATGIEVAERRRRSWSSSRAARSASKHRGST